MALRSAQQKAKAHRKPRSDAGRLRAKAACNMTPEKWKALQEGMAEKWPQPEYMKTPHGRGATSYRDETYEVTTRWKAGTKIAYRPHAKAPGSQCHLRYEKYSKAKTVGEALKLGSSPGDWCWDYERGFIKVLGPVRDEPLDLSKADDKDITDVDRAIWRWYLRELSKRHGLTVADLKGGCSGETLIMRAHRLVAQREARRILEAAEREHRLVSDEEVSLVLQKWAFAKNISRVNVMPDGQDWVWSDTLGLLRDRVGDIHLTPPTLTYPDVAAVLNKYLHDRLPPEASSFKWTSLNLNCNYAAKRHRDGNNFGPSFIKAFGDFKHGELCYWPEDDRQTDDLSKLKDKDKLKLNLKKGLVLFNGNCGHSVEDFEGQRYSVVYFTVRCFDDAPSACKDQLRALGMRYPESGEDRYGLLRAPCGYSKGSKAAGGRGRPYGFWESAALGKPGAPRAFPLLKVVSTLKSEFEGERQAAKIAAVQAKRKARFAGKAKAASGGKRQAVAMKTPLKRKAASEHATPQKRDAQKAKRQKTSKH